MAQIITSVTLSNRHVRPDVGGARRGRRRRAGTVTYCAGACGRKRRGILYALAGGSDLERHFPAADVVMG